MIDFPCGHCSKSPCICKPGISSDRTTPYEKAADELTALGQEIENDMKTFDQGYQAGLKRGAAIVREHWKKLPTATWEGFGLIEVEQAILAEILPDANHPRDNANQG